MKKLFILILMLLVLTSCGDDESQKKECDSACSEWQICDTKKGECISAEDRCEANSECTKTNKSRCNLTTHTCEEQCSPTAVFGFCEEGQYCYKGACIGNEAECEKDNVLAPCENKTTHYCKKNDEDIYECLPYWCSFSRPTGYCENEQTCVNGECIDICSESKPQGKCLDGENISEALTCVNGICEAI